MDILTLMLLVYVMAFGTVVALLLRSIGTPPGAAKVLAVGGAVVTVLSIAVGRALSKPSPAQRALVNVTSISLVVAAAGVMLLVMP